MQSGGRKIEERDLPPMSRSAKLAIWAVASASLMVVGALGPWAKALGGFVSVSGTDGDGTVVLIAGLVVVGIVALMRRKKRVWMVVVGLLAAVIGAFTSIYDLANIKSVVDSSSGMATVGWGLWLDAIASVSGVLALLVLARVKPAVRSQRDNPPVLDPDTTSTELGSHG
jgi:hypothetical protein